MSGAMVQAILNGSKTRTRRVTGGCTVMLRGMTAGLAGPDTDQIHFDVESGEWYCEGGLWHKRCPYGREGDRLWVRETWRQGPNGIEYRADDDRHPLPPWKPSIYMPRVVSRVTLEIASIRVERLQDITEEDAKAEGVAAWAAAYCSRRPEDELYARAYFELMWNQINGERGYGWESNPFVWVIAFDPVPAPTRGREGRT